MVRTLNSVVVDVDDTLVSTHRSMQGVWREVLGLEIPLEDIEALSLEQVFMKFASPKQKTRANELQKQFWDIVLCLDDVGFELLKLHEPVPFAADVLQQWSKHCMLVYFTGRPETARDMTLDELERFRFPTSNVQLVMFDVEDFARVRGVNPSGPTLVDARFRLFSSISQKYNVVRVVDDYPSYFPIYERFRVPDRIGLLRQKRYSSQQYIEKGATRIVESWEQLRDDLPR